MQVLVTGGAGYIGSHTVRELLKHGHEVVIIDSLVHGHRESVPSGDSIQFFEGNITDSNLLDQIFTESSIELVVHFAAYAYVSESIEDPLKYYENNVSASIQLLKSMKKHNIKNIVFSSTCATYGKADSLPITEEQNQNPINPYGSSKLMLEKIIKDCHQAWGLKYVILRYFNAAGCSLDGKIGEDHDPETHLIPLLLMAISGHRKMIKVFGDDYPTKDGTCIRDYIHVEDLADAHVKALNHLENEGEVNEFNLGAGRGVSIKELISSAEKITGQKVPVTYVERRAGDPPELIADATKANNLLGWKANYTDVEVILKTAWRWHIDHPNGYK